MSPRRRAALLLGLALVLGGLAASDVARREDALRGQLAPLVSVVVAREPLDQGRRLRATDLAVRPIPARFAPPGGAVPPELLVGRRLAVPVVKGAALNELLLERPQAPPATAVGRGERAVEVVAAAAPGTVEPGSRVDVVVTRDRGGTQLTLQDVPVLAVRGAPATDERAAGKIAATLRVPVQGAIQLTAAGAFARELRLLARAPGDRSRLNLLPSS